MSENIKTFWKDHKTEILLGGVGVASVAALVYLAITGSSKANVIFETSLSSKSELMNFVLGADDTSKYLIFKETAEPIFDIMTLP